MFNWLGNIFPYSDLHSLNLDWILTKMKETAAQAAKAIADSANALAQVIEAKTAAQNAQTAAQHAQTAANNAQTAANNAQTAANNAADSAENAVNVAQAANSAAQTAQNTANTAQNTAQKASERVQTLDAKFPIHASDISEDSRTSYLVKYPSYSWTFPSSGMATKEEITAGVMGSYRFLEGANTEYWQFSMDIREDGQTLSNTVFTCFAAVSRYFLKKAEGLMFLVPIIVIKNDTNQRYDGLIKITKIPYSGTLTPKCEVIFETEPPFNANTLFVITATAVEAKISDQP